jgi:hypothetical protein
MKFTTIVAVLALFGVVSVNGLQIKGKIQAAQTEKLFSNFISKFSRNYKNNNEYATRLGHFSKNVDIVNAHNAANTDF